MFTCSHRRASIGRTLAYTTCFLVTTETPSMLTCEGMLAVLKNICTEGGTGLNPAGVCTP